MPYVIRILEPKIYSEDKSNVIPWIQIAPYLKRENMHLTKHNETRSP